MYQTPILIFVYNRPEQTKRLLQQLAHLTARRFIITADGPKYGNKLDIQKVKRVRQLVKNFSKGRDVIFEFSDANLGLKQRVVSGLQLAFAKHETLIILEYDCLPSLDFIWFCDLMLEKFRDNPKVGMIQGVNPFFQTSRVTPLLYLSDRPKIWGWATWRRVFEGYDPDLRDWSNRSKIEKYHFLKEHDFRYGSLLKKWRELNSANEINTWDYQWVYHLWLKNLYSLVPPINLITNLGFGKDATHTLFINPISSGAALQFEPQQAENLKKFNQNSLTSYRVDLDRQEKRMEFARLVQFFATKPVSFFFEACKYLAERIRRKVNAF